MNKKIICIVGTRPEVIKMAPVIKQLRSHGINAPILATAQHRDLLDQMLRVFSLVADWDFDVMAADQTPGEVTGRLIPKLESHFRLERPDAVLAQGDTVTVFCAALAAFYAGIPFGHVEAGLRSGDLAAPFPEEAMRRMTSVLTRWHFAPTHTSRSALLHEGFDPSTILVTGNTVIDALLETAACLPHPWPKGIRSLTPSERLVLVTLHRRENFGPPLARMLKAIVQFAKTHQDARIIYPVHPNPNVKGPAEDLLGPIPNIDLIKPVDYPTLVGLLASSYMVWTDSGGLQEEGPALGKPVLVFRAVTERPEAVDAGGVALVGSDPDVFLALAEDLWNDPASYKAMAIPRFPYGDGKASFRIAEHLQNILGN